MIEIVRCDFEVPVFINRSEAFYEALSNTGFALIEFEESPTGTLIEAVRRFRADGTVDDALVDHVWGRFNEIDTSRESAGLPRIKSNKVEVFAKQGIEGSDNPHVDRMHRECERVIEVIDEPRAWHLWLPRPDFIKRGKAKIPEDTKPDVIINATPGSALVLNMRARGENRAAAAKSSVIHSYFPSSANSMSLLYARIFRGDMLGVASRLRYRAPDFPDFSR